MNLATIEKSYRQRFLFDGIEAIWLIAENVVRFYNENGQMLKSVGVGTVEQEKAA